MSIGLYDADFFTYHQTIFNLEIMKLSTYYKKKREITIMAPSFSPERYTQFFYRKDFNDGNFPVQLTQYKNLSYGGLAFSGNKYIPLPEEIEQCAPDASVYERYKDIFIENSPTNKKFYTSVLKGVHFRLSLDEKNIWKDFEKQIPKQTKGRMFFLHDYNLNNIVGAQETIQSIIQKYQLSELQKNSLCVKFPINCYDFESFDSWFNFIFSTVNFKLQYNGMLEDEQLNEIMEKTNFTQSENIFYNPLPSSYDKNDFSEEALIKIFTQALFLYKNQKHFLLICNDSFQVPKEIKNMFRLFSSYIRSGQKPATSLFYFTKQLREKDKYKQNILLKQDAIDVFYYTQENYPNLLKLFYENYGAVFQGGKLQVVR